MRQGLFLFCSALLGCSGPAARPDAESWPASPVASATLDSDTIPVLPATASDEEEQQPAVLFRCEEGRLGAYLMPAGGGDGSGVEEEQMVPIILDSAPSCGGKAVIR